MASQESFLQRVGYLVPAILADLNVHYCPFTVANFIVTLKKAEFPVNDFASLSAPPSAIFASFIETCERVPSDQVAKAFHALLGDNNEAESFQWAARFLTGGNELLVRIEEPTEFSLFLTGKVTSLSAPLPLGTITYDPEFGAAYVRQTLGTLGLDAFAEQVLPNADFLVFQGPQLAGKSLQVARLVAHLAAQPDFDVIAHVKTDVRDIVDDLAHGEPRHPIASPELSRIIAQLAQSAVISVLNHSSSSQIQPAQHATEPRATTFLRKYCRNLKSVITDIAQRREREPHKNIYAILSDSIFNAIAYAGLGRAKCIIVIEIEDGASDDNPRLLEGTSGAGEIEGHGPFGIVAKWLARQGSLELPRSMPAHAHPDGCVKVVLTSRHLHTTTSPSIFRSIGRGVVQLSFFSESECCAFVCHMFGERWPNRFGDRTVASVAQIGHAYTHGYPWLFLRWLEGVTYFIEGLDEFDLADVLVAVRRWPQLWYYETPLVVGAGESAQTEMLWPDGQAASAFLTTVHQTLSDNRPLVEFFDAIVHADLNESDGIAVEIENLYATPLIRAGLVRYEGGMRSTFVPSCPLVQEWFSPSVLGDFLENWL